jgi:putative transposase
VRKRIRLETEFVYLAVVLDAYSRRVIGWALERTQEDDLTIAALQMALQTRSPGPALVHHSERGNPYDKAYASHCTSSGPCATSSPAGRLFDSLTPMALRGGLSPGCS